MSGPMLYVNLKTPDISAYTFPAGPAGRNGVDGINGVDGVDGYSAYEIAVRHGFCGTEEEWLDSMVTGDIIQRLSAPEFANDISECTDVKKLYVLPDGYLYAYFQSGTLIPTFLNELEYAQDTDGSIFNDIGYKNGKRLDSSGAVVNEQSTTSVSGFIPVSSGDVLRFSPGLIKTNIPNSQGWEIFVYDSSKTRFTDSSIQQTNLLGNYGSTQHLIADVTTDSNNNVLSFSYDPDSSAPQTGFIRFTFHKHCDSHSVVTLNQAITYTHGVGTWQSTGHKYQAAEYEDRIAQLENEVARLKNDGGYKNLADVDSSEWKTDTVITSSGTTEDLSGYTTTNLIPVTQGDVVRVYGISLIGTLNRTASYGANKTVRSAELFRRHDSLESTVIYRQGGECRVCSSGVKYLRFSGVRTAEKIIITVNEDIAELHGCVVPDNWKSEIENKIKEVKNRQSSGGKDAFSFAWASDLHIPDMLAGCTLSMGALMNAMLDGCCIPFAVITGDINSQTSFGTKDELISGMDGFSKHLQPLWGTEKLLVAIGDHDGAYGDEYDKHLTDAEMWDAYIRPQICDERRVFGDDGTYFYIDNAIRKVRFIVLNSQKVNGFTPGDFGATQLDWLNNALTGMPEGYSAILFSHIAPISGTWDNAMTGTSISGFTSVVNGKNIIAMFCGHAHKDAVDASSFDFPVIMITTSGGDVKDENAETRVIGTDNETAFDVVTVNKADGKIYCTRIGAGSSRIVSFAKNES